MVDEKIDELLADLEKSEPKFPHIHGDCNRTHFSNCFKHVKLDGLWMEFGVFQGKSIGTIANCNPDQTIYGFDSFEGLPEDWTPTNPKGTFSLGGNVPDRIFRGENVIHGQVWEPVPENVVFIKGWFEDTLPGFVDEHQENVAFIHIDSDLYSSCKTILGVFKDRIVPGTVMCFDDWCGYPHNTDRDHEVKAFAEFLLETELKAKPISYQTHEHYSQVGFLIQ